MSAKDLSDHLEDIYGIAVSKGILTAITDKIIHSVKAWQARSLISMYPIVWLDATHNKISEDGVGTNTGRLNQENKHGKAKAIHLLS